MHGSINGGSLAADGAAPCLAAWQPSVQSADPSHAVAAGRPQHGAGMAASAGHPFPGQYAQRRGEADLGSLRPSGSGHRCTKGETDANERVACVGQPTSHADAPVCAEERPPSIGGAVTTSSVLALLEHQQFRCALTGRPLTPESAALDHIVPIRCGGQHVIENTQVLHKDVNRAKNSMTNEAFARLCEEVAETWRRRGGNQ